MVYRTRLLESRGPFASKWAKTTTIVGGNARMTRTSLFAATLLFAAFSTSADAVALGDDQSPEMTLTREPMGMPTPMIEFVEHNPTLQSATIPFVDDEGRYFEALVNLSNRGYVVRNAAGQTVGSGTISIARRDLLLEMLSEDDDGVID